MKYVPGRFGVIGVAAMTLMVVAGQPAAYGQVSFRTSPDQVQVVQTPGQVENALMHLASRPTALRVVVEFARPVDAGEKAKLAAMGVSLMSYLGDNAYFATLKGRVDARGVLGVVPMVSARAIQTDWKLHPMLAAGQVAEWTVIDPTDATNPTVVVYTVLHQDVDLLDAAQIMKQHGGLIQSALESINGVVVELPYDSIRELAGDDSVMWVEPALPGMGELNAENRVLTQVNELQAAPFGLDGTGVTAFIYDAGQARASHSDFSGRLTVIPGDTSGLSNHSTHVSGTVGGDGSLNNNNRGMAPNVTLLSAGFEQVGGLQEGFLYTDPGDLETDYAMAISMGADVANNSIGTNTAPNGFPCIWTGDYGVTSSVIDAVVRGSQGAPLTIVWANGNERQTTRCGSLYNTTAPPACAKNHITVGATNANNDSITSFTSWGPTDDGRIKPDISAPGCQIGGDNGVTSTSSSGGYTVMCGTSMASPTVAGIVALMIQDFRIQFPTQPDPSASMVKVLLAQGAMDQGNPGPDNQFGYGSVRARDTIEFMRTGFFRESSLSQGDSELFTVTVAPGDPELMVTIAWSDVPGTPNVIPSLVNNLDIEVIDPAGTVHYPWTLVPGNPGSPAVQTGANTLDNIEQVFVANPMPGAWTVTINGTAVPSGPQGYSIAGSPNLLNFGGTFLAINVSSSVPALVAPGVAVPVDVTVTSINETIVSGSELLHYRFASGAYIDVPMTDMGGGLYSTAVPAANCGDVPEFYVSIIGQSAGLLESPAGGGANPLGYAIGVNGIVFQEDFATDAGFTVTDVSVLGGSWQFGAPAGDGTRLDPLVDFDGNGTCWLTQNAIGNTDVDGGPTTLTSTVYDLSGQVGSAMTFAYWMSNDDNDDPFWVDVSNDAGASWVEAFRVVGGNDGWNEATVNLDDFVVSTSQMMVRFSVQDVPNNSITEAAVDSIRFTGFVCDSVCPVDLNNDGTVDVLDFFAFISLFNAGDLAVDFDGSGVVDVLDFFAFIVQFDIGCG